MKNPIYIPSHWSLIYLGMQVVQIKIPKPEKDIPTKNKLALMSPGFQNPMRKGINKVPTKKDPSTFQIFSIERKK